MSIASNYALRLPASLKRELEKVARDDGTSLNQLIVTAVAEKLPPCAPPTSSRNAAPAPTWGPHLPL